MRLHEFDQNMLIKSHSVTYLRRFTGPTGIPVGNSTDVKVFQVTYFVSDLFHFLLFVSVEIKLGTNVITYFLFNILRSLHDSYIDIDIDIVFY